jgi:hypothetical protein
MKLRSLPGTSVSTMTLRSSKTVIGTADELKEFGFRIGIPAAKKLRKDELERRHRCFSAHR